MAECVMCGFCCRQAPCAYGQWDEVKHACVYLTTSNLCSRYEEIKSYAGSKMSPAFGAGCSSPLFNEDRAKVLLLGQQFPEIKLAMDNLNLLKERANSLQEEVNAREYSHNITSALCEEISGWIDRMNLLMTKSQDCVNHGQYIAMVVEARTLHQCSAKVLEALKK